MNPEATRSASVSTAVSHSSEASRWIPAAVAAAGVAMAMIGGSGVAGAATGDDADARTDTVSRPSTSNTVTHRPHRSADSDSEASGSSRDGTGPESDGQSDDSAIDDDAAPVTDSDADDIDDDAAPVTDSDSDEELAAGHHSHHPERATRSHAAGEALETPDSGTDHGDDDLDATEAEPSAEATPEEPATTTSARDGERDRTHTAGRTDAHLEQPTVAATAVHQRGAPRTRDPETEASIPPPRSAGTSPTVAATDVLNTPLRATPHTTPEGSDPDLTPAAPATPLSPVTASLSSPPAAEPDTVTYKSIVADLMTWLGMGRFATNLPGPGLPVPRALASVWLVVRQSQYKWNNQRPAADPTASTELTLDGAVVGDLNAVDHEGDALTYSVTGAPAHGTVVVDDQGHFTYVPDAPAGSAVIDQFTVTIDDTVGNPPHYYGLLGLAGLLEAPTVTENVAVPSAGDVSIAPPPRPLEAAMLAAQAYLYGYPLLETDRLQAEAPATNTLLAFTTYIDPDQHLVVAPNVDTLYTLAYLDLSEGPVVLSHPDMGDRYFVFQLMDPYTNVVGYIGSRTTGSEAASYAIVWEDGPEAQIPPDAEVIVVPYSDIWLLGRTLAGDETDQQEAVALMLQYSLTAPNGPETYPIEGIDTSTSEPLPTGVDALDAISAAMAASPPPDGDADKLAELIRIGVGPGLEVSDANLSPAATWAADAAVRTMSALLDPLVKLSQYSMAARNEGWASPDPAIGDYGTDYLLRAGVAKIGLGANTPEEAFYATAFLDENLRRLDGKNSYQLHFDPGQEPPADAFWSITVYDAEGFLVPNEQEIYAVSSTGSGNLVYQEDGSIDIVFSQEDPNDPNVNWIPVPDGSFRVYLRVYDPQEAVLDSSWVVPGIERL